MRNPLCKLALAVLLSSSLCACQTEQSPPPHPVAERVFLNGAIYTADAQRRTLSAMALTGDRIVFVGSTAEVRNWIDERTLVTDLQGRRVLPGLHDAHVHPVETIHIDKCDLEGQAKNLAELASFVTTCLNAATTAPNEWLVVKNWNFSDGNKPADNLQTLRTALDRASASRPILLESTDSHRFATNTSGLSLAQNRGGEQVGLSAATVQEHFSDLAPYIGLDANGEPNGEVHETVYRRLGVTRAILLNLPALTAEAAQMPAWFNSRGITSLLEAAFYPELAPVYDTLATAGALSLRITLAQHYEPEDFLSADHTLDMPAMLRQANVTREKYAGVANIKADQLKYFVDGVLEGNPLSNPPGLPNAAQLEKYQQPLFQLDPTSQELTLTGYADTGSSAGVTFQSAATTKRFIQAAVADNFSVHFHAIGDRAVRDATDAIAAVTSNAPGSNRHSITHAQLISPQDIKRIAELRIPVVFTYSWAIRDFAYDLTVIPFIDKIASLQHIYDPANYYLQQAYPAQSILRAGGVLAAGSDAPVGGSDPLPFQNIEMAVTRDNGEGPLNESEGIDILEAIDAYTINGARLMQQDDITGSLEAGKKADFIIIDRDIIALAQNEGIKDVSATKVLETWFDGRLVYQQAR